MGLAIAGAVMQGIVLQRIFLCALVVRPKHPDFTTEAQRHEDEINSIPGLPQKTAKNRLYWDH